MTAAPLVSVFPPIRIIPWTAWTKSDPPPATRSFVTLASTRFIIVPDEYAIRQTNFSQCSKDSPRLTGLDVFHRVSLRCIRFSSRTRVSVSFLSKPCNRKATGARAHVHATAAFKREATLSRKDGTRCTMRDTPLEPKRYVRIGNRKPATTILHRRRLAANWITVLARCASELFRVPLGSQFPPPCRLSRSAESPSLFALTVGSHPLIQDQFLFGQSGDATTRRDPTTRVPPHWIEDPAATPRYRKPADHWTSRRYSLLSSSSLSSFSVSLNLTFTSTKIPTIKFLESREKFQRELELTSIWPPFCATPRPCVNWNRFRFIIAGPILALSIDDNDQV